MVYFVSKQMLDIDELSADIALAMPNLSAPAPLRSLPNPSSRSGAEPPETMSRSGGGNVDPPSEQSYSRIASSSGGGASGHRGSRSRIHRGQSVDPDGAGSRSRDPDAGAGPPPSGGGARRAPVGVLRASSTTPALERHLARTRRQRNALRLHGYGGGGDPASSQPPPLSTVGDDSSSPGEEVAAVEGASSASGGRHSGAGRNDVNVLPSPALSAGSQRRGWNSVGSNGHPIANSNHKRDMRNHPKQRLPLKAKDSDVEAQGGYAHNRVTFADRTFRPKSGAAATAPSPAAAVGSVGSRLDGALALLRRVSAQARPAGEGAAATSRRARAAAPDSGPPSTAAGVEAHEVGHERGYLKKHAAVLSVMAVLSVGMMATTYSSADNNTLGGGGAGGMVTWAKQRGLVDVDLNGNDVRSPALEGGVGVGLGLPDEGSVTNGNDVGWNTIMGVDRKQPQQQQQIMDQQQLQIQTDLQEQIQAMNTLVGQEGIISSSSIHNNALANPSEVSSANGPEFDRLQEELERTNSSAAQPVQEGSLELERLQQELEVARQRQAQWEAEAAADRQRAEVDTEDAAAQREAAKQEGTAAGAAEPPRARAGGAESPLMALFRTKRAHTRQAARLRKPHGGR